MADGKPVTPKSEKIRFSELAALVVDDYTINHDKSLTAARMLDRFTDAAQGFDAARRPTPKTRHSTAAPSTNASTKLQSVLKTSA